MEYQMNSSEVSSTRCNEFPFWWSSCHQTSQAHRRSEDFIRLRRSSGVECLFSRLIEMKTPNSGMSVIFPLPTSHKSLSSNCLWSSNWNNSVIQHQHESLYTSPNMNYMAFRIHVLLQKGCATPLLSQLFPSIQPMEFGASNMFTALFSFLICVGKWKTYDHFGTNLFKCSPFKYRY